MEAFKDDMRYKQGRKMLAENNYESAIEFFSELLQSRIALYGEQSIEVAPAWFEYGRALLMKEQDNPSDDLLGAMAAEAKKQAQALGDDLSAGVDDEDVEEESAIAQDVDVDDEEEEEDDKSAAQGGSGEATAGDEDEPSDMEIAWEALEVCRKIYETENDSAHDEALSEVYEALGDVSRFNGNFPGAIEEYKKCVALREAALEDSDRLLAQAYYSLAVAHIYNASEEGVDALSSKKAALQNYEAARRTLLLPPSANVLPPRGDTCSSSESDPAALLAREMHDRKELCDEIDETVTALKEEIKELAKTSSGASGWRSGIASASSSSETTTTIGFGQSGNHHSELGASSSSTTTIGFGAQSITATATTIATTTNGLGATTATTTAADPSTTTETNASTMTVKRKVKPESSSLSSDASSSAHVQKKSKTGEECQSSSSNTINDASG